MFLDAFSVLKLSFIAQKPTFVNYLPPPQKKTSKQYENDKIKVTISNSSSSFQVHKFGLF